MKPVTITAGHGGSDPGAVYGGLTERELMTDLRDRVRFHLVNYHDLTVRADGAWGVNDPLASALHLIAGSSVAIELHCNAAASPQANGVEVVAGEANAPLARKLAKAIAGAMGSRVRGDGGWIDQAQTARGRIGFVARGGLVVEVFFLSNPDELKRYQSKKAEVAYVIARTIAQHVKENP